MKLYLLEIKRIFKMKQTIILLIIGFLMAFLMAYLPISFVVVKETDSAGQVSEITGKKAIDYINNARSENYGIITIDKLYAATEKYKTEFKKNNVSQYYDMPLSIYNKEILPIKHLVSRLPEVYADSKTGIGPEIQNIQLDDVNKFYEKAVSHLSDIMKLEYRNDIVTREIAENMYAKVKKPFEIHGYFTRGAFDYIVLYIMILVIICTSIASPTFSENYQNGLDSIFRTTKNGRARFVISRILALATIFIVFYSVCMFVQVTIMNRAFGVEYLKTSVQMIFSTISLIPMNIGQLQLATIGGGLLSLLATMSFTIFMSSKMRTSRSTMMITILICIFPSIIYGAIELNWFNFIFPSSGVGLQNNLLYQLIDINFVKIFSKSIWSAKLIVISAVVEFVAFLAFTIRTYCRHEVI